LQTIFFQVASNILANESEQTQNTQMFMFWVLRFEIMHLDKKNLRSPKEHKFPSFWFYIASLKFFASSLFIFEHFSSNALV
jgi:hypothetical protein